MKTESLGGVFLVVSAVVAMVLANSTWGPAYEAILHLPLTFGVNGYVINLSVLHWINDAVMAVFFFAVGLEIKKEFLFGELKTPSATLLPIAGAIGGMVVPAAIYAAFNLGTPAVSGWGIPMATDIAFSLGVLSLVAPQAPRSIVVFLTALAIVDDLGGILVIALFYTSELALLYLVVGAVVFGGLQIACRQKVAHISFYIAGGIVLWYLFLRGGIHPTIAGVLLGFSIPAGRDGAGGLLVQTEHSIAPYSTFFIMPVFALANAGIVLNLESLGQLVSPVGLGVLCGLFLGKPLGIMAAVGGILRSGLSDMPEGVKMGHFLGAGMLGGIGFTMSLFIAALAFADAASLGTAKMAIVTASVLAAVGGGLVFLVTNSFIDGRERPEYNEGRNGFTK